MNYTKRNFSVSLLKGELTSLSSDRFFVRKQCSPTRKFSAGFLRPREVFKCICTWNSIYMCVNVITVEMVALLQSHLWYLLRFIIFWCVSGAFHLPLLCISKALELKNFTLRKSLRKFHSWNNEKSKNVSALWPTKGF